MNASRAADRPVVLAADEVTVRIPTPDGVVTPVDHVSLDLRQGEVLGIVGETGSGKTVTCRSLLGLMPSPRATHTGSVRYPGVADDNVLDLGARGMRRHWGTYVSMIPQNPMTSLNPVHRIGAQIDEAIAAHSSMSRAQRHERIIELMTRVASRCRTTTARLPAPVQWRDAAAHADRHRARRRTQIVVADEPTTALDVIIQDQILSLLLDLQRDMGMSLVLVSHDLSVIAQICDRVAVMYGGQVVELSATEELLQRPQHPYTAALLSHCPAPCLVTSR